MEEEAAKIESDDRILQLPKKIVLNILSCLPFKDSVCTTILSKRWQNLWITAVKKLKFSYDYFDDMKTYRPKSKEHLIDFMERTLRSCQTQMVQLEKLSIYVPFQHAEIATLLDRCISYGIGCNVTNLKLGYYGTSFNCLPRNFFVATTKFMNLRLWGWKLESLSFHNVNFCCLIKLSLSCVSVDDDQMIQNLIASCPVIEDLSLYMCRGLKGTLNIFGLVNPKLVTMHVSECEFGRVEIEALSIEDFEFRNNGPCEISMSNCKNMRTLRLDSASITDKSLSNFRHLEVLVLVNCAMVETIKISSCRLERLEVRRCRNLVKVHIDSPKLRWFTYSGGNALSFSSTNALALEETYISLHPDNVDTLWYTKLTEFIGKFSNSKVLKLRSDVDEFVKNFIVPEELRESLRPPLFNVKHLILELHGYLLDEIVEDCRFLALVCSSSSMYRSI